MYWLSTEYECLIQMNKDKVERFILFYLGLAYIKSGESNKSKDRVAAAPIAPQKKQECHQKKFGPVKQHRKSHHVTKDPFGRPRMS